MTILYILIHYLNHHTYQSLGDLTQN